MSKTVRYKLSEEEHRVVLDAANGLGISVDALAYQALALVLQQARTLKEKALEGADQVEQQVEATKELAVAASRADISDFLEEHGVGYVHHSPPEVVEEK